jgi:hypothetical protein
MHLLLRDLVKEDPAVKLLNDTCVLPEHFSHVGDHSCCLRHIVHLQACVQQHLGVLDRETS